MSSKALKWITPTFQQALNKQIAKIMDAIDEGNLVLAYVALKTLIGALKPVDRDRLLMENVAPIDKALRNVGNGRSINFYVGALHSSKIQENILVANIRPLYMEVMGTLHAGGYLEVIRKPTPTNIPTRLADQLLQ